MKKLINYLLTEIENLKSEMTSKTHAVINLEYEVSFFHDILENKNARISELEAQVSHLGKSSGLFGDLEEEKISRKTEEDIF